MPTDYLNLKVKIVREQGKVTPINDQLILEKIVELGSRSIKQGHVPAIMNFWSKYNLLV